MNVQINGLDAIKGYSAYEVAVFNGFEGTEEEWLESLKGAPGAPGKDGAQGPQGEPGSVVFEELTEEQKELLRGAPGKDGEDGQDGAPGKDGTDGKDGVSPTVSVAVISGGHRVTITDANGAKTFDVMDGEGGGGSGGGASGEDGVTFYPAVSADGVLSWTNDGGLTNPEPVNIKGADGEDGADGAAGKDGDDGVSPVVSVAAITGGHRITITDANGTKTVDVMDGTDGNDGAAGKDGTSVTVTNVTESTEDGGSNVVTFSDGKTVTIKNGTNGLSAFAQAKAAGYTGSEAEFYAALIMIGSKADADHTHDDLVPTTRTVNGKALSADVTLSAADVSARAKTWVPSQTEVTVAAATDYSTVRVRGICIVANEAVSVPNGCFCAVYSTS